MTWHVEPKILQAYAAGRVADTHAYSVEAHVLECETCRDLLGRYVDPHRLNTIWSGIVDTAVLPPSGLVERFLLRVGVKDYLARLLTATPSLHLSWFASIALVLSFAVIAAYTNSNGFVIFLVLAPLLPLAGIAAAYGPGVDPTYEIGLVAPMRSFNLLMIRAAAVLATSGVMALIAALAMPQRNWALVAWLLPSMGLALISLAFSTVIAPLRSAVTVALIWVMGCGMGIAYSSRTTASLEDFFGGVLQPILAGLTMVAALMIFHRREVFEGGRRR